MMPNKCGRHIYDDLRLVVVCGGMLREYVFIYIVICRRIMSQVHIFQAQVNCLASVFIAITYILCFRGSYLQIRLTYALVLLTVNIFFTLIYNNFIMLLPFTSINHHSLDWYLIIWYIRFTIYFDKWHCRIQYTTSTILNLFRSCASEFHIPLIHGPLNWLLLY